MAYQEHDHLTSAELQREVAEERRKIDRTISELQAKIDPGRIADNLFSSRMMGDAVSAASRGGADFAGNFGKTLAANPIPAALLGISLAWLMAGPRPFGNGADTNHAHEPRYRTIDGDGLRRISHARDEAGEWYSEFADQAGRTYRAKSNEAGHRIGNFMDSAGEAVGGFVDKSGRMVTRFTDEAGSMLDEAAGWARGAADAAAGAMGGIAETASKAGGGIAHTASRVAGSAGHMGTSLQHGAERAARDTRRLIEEQPLIAGAIAFAAGAAIAAALPRTRHEDEVLGDISDEARTSAAHTAGRFYEEGKEMASEFYEETAEEVGELYDEAKSKVAGDRTAEQEPPPDVRH